MRNLRKAVLLIAATAGLAAAGAAPAQADLQVCGSTHATGFIGGQFWIIGNGSGGCTYRYVVYYTIAGGPAYLEGASTYTARDFGLRTSYPVAPFTTITIAELYRTPSQSAGQRTFTAMRFF